jgi:hypothetical protein
MQLQRGHIARGIVLSAFATFLDHCVSSYLASTFQERTIMKQSVIPVALLVLAVGASVAPLAMAHHAFAAEFDADKPIDLKGTVTRARWVNPHSWLYFDVKNSDGTVTNWGVEFGTPNQLANKGLSKEDLKAGTEVHIKGYRSKNGGAFGYSVTLTLKDGRTFQTGGAQDGPASAAVR